MTTFLLFDDPAHSPAVRHEIGEPVIGPLTFIEHDGKRIVVGDESDRATFARREDVVDEFWAEHELGWEELFNDESFPTHLVGPEVLLRALGRRQGRRSSNFPCPLRGLSAREGRRRVHR